MRVSSRRSFLGGLSRLTLGALVALVVLAEPVAAGWNPVTGLKDGSDAAIEAADPWIGPELVVQGGTLDFLGSADVSGQVSIVEQSGWGDPEVEIAGGLTVVGPHLSVLDGARLEVLGAMPGTVTTGFVTINGGSQATIGSLSSSNDSAIDGLGSTLHVRGNYQQSAGLFRVSDGGSLEVDGTFNYSGNVSFAVVNGSTFSVGTLGGSVQAHDFVVTGGSDVAVGPLTTSHDTAVDGVGSSLHVLGNYQQSGGLFRLSDGSSLEVDGTFNYSGNVSFAVVNGSNFSVGTLGGSVQAHDFVVSGGSDVAVGPLTTSHDTAVDGVGSSLHVVGNYLQSGGLFRLSDGSSLEVDGTFNYSGNVSFAVVNGSNFSVGTLGGSVQAHDFVVSGGSDVAVGPLTTSHDTAVDGVGSSLHVLGNYQQSGGLFRLSDGSSLEVDGTFNYSGNVSFAVVNGSTFSVGTLGGSVQAHDFVVNGGSDVAVGPLTTSHDTAVDHAGSSIHVLGNYQQSGGLFRASDGGDFTTDGSFDYVTSGPANLDVTSDSTLQVGTTLHLSSGNLLTVAGRGNVGAGSLPGVGTLRVGAGGLVSGSGTIISNLLVDGGSVAPGDSPGLLAINGDALFDVPSTLDLEIGGLLAGIEHDQLDVAGDLTLAGDVNLIFTGGFVPEVGNVIELFKFGGLLDTSSASFHTVNVPAAFSYMLVPGADSLSLEVTAVPEPSTYALSMAGIGSAVLLGLRRRRQRAIRRE